MVLDPGFPGFFLGEMVFTRETRPAGDIEGGEKVTEFGPFWYATPLAMYPIPGASLR